MILLLISCKQDNSQESPKPEKPNIVFIMLMIMPIRPLALIVINSFRHPILSSFVVMELMRQGNSLQDSCEIDVKRIIERNPGFTKISRLHL